MSDLTSEPPTGSNHAPGKGTPPVTIVIIEDDTGIRQSLQAILDDEEDLRCVGTFASAEDALIHLPQLNPSVILMDVNLPGMGGIDCVRRLVSWKVPAQIVMLTVCQDTEIIFASLAAGASGYLLKPPTADELVAAVRSAATGGAPMTASIARRVVRSFNRELGPEFTSLSSRQLQVLDLLARGFTYKDVAAELGVSYSTTHRHIEIMYRKLRVSSRAHAVSKYLGRDQSRGEANK